MKTKLFLMLAIMPLVLLSCGGSDEDGTGGSEKESSKTKAEISVSDDVVGEKQIVELSVNYQTDNPNLLVTWYVDGERLNTIPKSELSYDWKAEGKGSHVVEVAITDREQVYKYQKAIDVIETELAGAIIGDSKSKIARTFGIVAGDEDFLTVKESVYQTNEYWFSNGKLTNIYATRNIPWNPKSQSDFMQPVSYFNSYYQIYVSKYGNPIKENFTNLGTNDSDWIDYGGHILSGSMEISATFQTSDREAELSVYPYTEYGYGFTSYQMLKKR